MTSHTLRSVLFSIFKGSLIFGLALAAFFSSASATHAAEEASTVAETAKTTIEGTGYMVTSYGAAAVNLEGLVFTLKGVSPNLLANVGSMIKVSGVAEDYLLTPSLIVVVHSGETIYSAPVAPVGGNDQVAEETPYNGTLGVRSGKIALINLEPELYYGMNAAGVGIFLDNIGDKNIEYYFLGTRPRQAEVYGEVSFPDGSAHIWVDKITVNGQLL